MEQLSMERYEDAIKDYHRLLEINPNSPDYNFEIGIAYLRSPNDYDKAEQYFERALAGSQGDTIPEMYFYLGKSYQYNHKFKEAKECYEKFKPNIKTNKAGRALLAEVNWLIKTCQHGEYHVKLNTKNPLENKKKPLNDIKKYFLNSTDFVVMENLGEKINSKSDEYAPIFFDMENEILFTSRRNPFGATNYSSDGKPFEQIYVSKYQNQEWKDAYLVNNYQMFPEGFVEIRSHVATISLSEENKTVYLYKDGKIYSTRIENKMWTEPELLNSTINYKKSRQSSAALSPDGNKMYITSDRKGGYGGLDIYVSEKQSDGTWSDPVNLGPVINTEFDEDCPFLDKDDNLYFSSVGHSSIGGFDVFYSYQENGNWITPKSLGIPINTPADEISYRKSASVDTIAYYASSRIDGYGYKDIYRITTHYEFRQRDTLPDIAMGGLMSDSLRMEQLAQAKADSAALAEGGETGTETGTGTGTGTETGSGTETGAGTTVVGAGTGAVAVAGGKDEKDQTVAQAGTGTGEGDTPVKGGKPVIKSQEDLDDMFRNILFGFNGNSVAPESEDQVKAIAQYLNDNPNTVINLSGHADYLGTDSVNMEVSKQRALVVFNDLVNDGANPYQITFDYYGEDKPIAEDHNPDGSDRPEGRRLNRRVEFQLEENKLFRYIPFGFDSYAVSKDGEVTLKEVADFMNQNPPLLWC